GGFWGDTDSRKPFYYWAEFDYSKSQSGGWYWGTYPGVTWKPKANISLSGGPGFDRTHEDSQYRGPVATAAATQTFGQRPVLAQLDQTRFSASIRLNWSFTPNAGIQLYAQPLISSGNYFAYKQLVRPRAYQWEPVGSGAPQYNPVTDEIDLGDGNG